MTRLLIVFLSLAALSYQSIEMEAFSLVSKFHRKDPFPIIHRNVHLKLSSDDGNSDDVGSTTTTTGTTGDEIKMSPLEEKMKKWEASEEEIRAASLGGIVPQPQQNGERTEAFDVGLYIAFPIMVITGLVFAFFPFIMGNIDVGDIEIPRV